MIYEIQEAFTAFIYVQLLVTKKTLAPKNVTVLGYFTHIFLVWRLEF
jgi:hypothetical protein